MAIIVAVLLAISIIASIVGYPVWQRYQEKRIGAQPFPKKWRKILKRCVPYYRELPTQQQLRLKSLIQIFIAKKPFIGCDGQKVTDEIRVIIAAQACLLLLNKRGLVYPKLNSILIYPRRFIRQDNHKSAAGVVSEQRTVLQGESWDHGRVVLSWNDARRGAIHPHDGHNVVIHEFAHQLDQERGSANGLPPLPQNMSRKRWTSSLQNAFDALTFRYEQGLTPVLDRYAMTNAAEFFAVASETFFEQANELARQFPRLFEQLSLFYGVDPRQWHQK